MRNPVQASNPKSVVKVSGHRLEPGAVGGPPGAKRRSLAGCRYEPGPGDKPVQTGRPAGFGCGARKLNKSARSASPPPGAGLGATTLPAAAVPPRPAPRRWSAGHDDGVGARVPPNARSAGSRGCGLPRFWNLFLLVAANRFRRRPWREQRPLIILALAGFFYSVGAVLFKQIAFPDATPLFVQDYLGDPPFSRISLKLVLTRLVFLPIYRAYFFWPAAAALAWAIRSRNILIVIGYLAFCPWLLLHIFANRDIPGTLSGYYAFPFLVAAAWPLAAIIIDARQRGIGPDRRHALAGFTIMLALSFLGLSKLWNPGQLDLWHNFTTPVTLARKQATDKAIEVLLAASTDHAGSTFGTLFIDQSIYSFAPYSFDAATVLGAIEKPLTTPKIPIDTIAYFGSGFNAEAIRGIIAHEHLTHVYRFVGTSILLASNRISTA